MRSAMYQQHGMAHGSVESVLLEPAIGSATLDEFLTGDNGESYLADPSIGDVGMPVAFARRTRAIPDTASAVSVDSVPLPEVVSLSIRGLRSMINSHLSLELARITSVEVWAEKFGSSSRLFLLLELRRARRRSIWLRLDRRRKVSTFRRFIRAPTNSTSDTAHLAASRGSLFDDSATHTIVQVTPSKTTTLGLLQHTLRIVCDELEQFQGSEMDEWLFCALLQQHLGHLKETTGQFIDGDSRYLPRARTISNRVKERLRLLRPALMQPLMSAPSSGLMIPGVLLLTVNQFCANPLATDGARIQILKRYKDQKGLKHEFIIIGAQAADASELWVRIDRAATLESSGPTGGSFLSNLPAKDSIRIARTETELLPSSSRIQSRATVSFPETSALARRPTVRDLAQVVGAINSVSPQYNLLKENCYFVASVIQDALTEMFAGALSGEPPSWAHRHAASATRDIYQMLTQDDALTVRQPTSDA